MARNTSNKLQEWWGNLTFEEMESITGFQQDDFSPEEGYQDFVDTCDEFWNKLSYAEKQRLHHEFA